MCWAGSNSQQCWPRLPPCCLLPASPRSAPLALPLWASSSDPQPFHHLSSNTHRRMPVRLLPSDALVQGQAPWRDPAAPAWRLEQHDWLVQNTKPVPSHAPAALRPVSSSAAKGAQGAEMHSLGRVLGPSLGEGSIAVRWQGGGSAGKSICPPGLREINPGLEDGISSWALP